MHRALREISNNSLGQVKGEENNREVLPWFSDSKENYDEGRKQDSEEVWKVIIQRISAPPPESLDKENHRNEAHE